MAIAPPTAGATLLALRNVGHSPNHRLLPNVDDGRAIRVSDIGCLVGRRRCGDGTTCNGRPVQAPLAEVVGEDLVDVDAGAVDKRAGVRRGVDNVLVQHGRGFSFAE